MNKETFTLQVGEKELTAEFSDLVEQANGSVIVRLGDTAVLATAVMSKNANASVGYFPLTVDYEERFYAAGAILGSRFMRREGKPSDEATLSGRVVDRTIRPLFDQWIRNDIQVVITVLSLGEDDPDVLSIIAASLALGVSDIPWNGPVGAVRIGKNGDDGFIVNPNYEFRKENNHTLDLLVCGKDGKINMIEVGSNEISEDTVTESIEKANEVISSIESWQKKIIKKIGKEKRKFPKPEIGKEAKNIFEEKIMPEMDSHVFSGPGKSGISKLEEKWKELIPEEENTSLCLEYFEEKLDEILHTEAIEKSRRADGRGMDEVRPLFAQAGGISKMLHGSGIFYRGGTHILSVITLGGPGDTQMIDTMEEQETQKRFMHHYNFPPYSTGETGRIGGTNRRMIGHGALAEKALRAIIPSKEIFPYTIRIVSESMASNGSTSMGSVCGSTLALLDAGVPIKAPVAGIASGLMMSGDKYKVLTDIQGPEDHHGDMDFKVAGTRNGITAIQMDVKVLGVPIEILKEALEKAKDARFHILDCIEKEIEKPRDNTSPFAPEIRVVKIKPEQIGMVIGSGGKVINEIKDNTGTEIDIDDDGTVFITGKNGSAKEAEKIIQNITKEYVVGEKAQGKVVKVLDFGAFVDLGNKEGLVHISEFAPFRVEKTTDLVKEGDVLPVVVKEVDREGRLKLSVKEVDPKFFDSKKPKD
ncbi:MAG: polyribonucleotide nucleotidyltransferase [Candidatus Pacebacteria bacterium]|nr:polyribonucleotide nucleotidyltransferase [Candidatus Paceibacterota bacterium]